MNPVLLASTSAMAETTPEQATISTSTTPAKAARFLYRRLD
jgi:flagellar hook-length control protein FliK